MLDNIEDEITIKNRILLREAPIKRLTNKYLDLIAKINTLTRSEIAGFAKDIINEIDTVEISILKAENLKKLKEIDIDHHRSLSSNLSNIGVNIDNQVEEISTQIEECDYRLVDARKEKEYRIHCEEIAKIINSYSTKETLEK
jgi:hypothetical protein